MEYSSAFSGTRICEFQADLTGFLAGLGFFFAFILACGLGGVFNMRNRTSSSRDNDFPIQIDLPWEAEKGLYMAVGAIIINWGVVDSAVAHSCDVLFELKANYGHKVAPKAFGKRLDLIKAGVKKKRGLRSLRRHTLAVIRETQKVVPYRDAMIHGVLHGWKKKTREFVFLILDPDGQQYTMRSRSISIKKLMQLHHAAIEASRGWTRILQCLYSLRDSQDRKKHSRRI